MSNFGSIEDLLGGNTAQVQPRRIKKRTPGGSTLSAQEAFQKKMKSIAQKEEETLTERYAAQIGLPYMDLHQFPISQAALKFLPREDAIRLGVICFYLDQDEMRFATIHPQRPDVFSFIEETKKKHELNTGLYLISQQSFDHVLEMYNRLPKISEIEKRVHVDAAAMQAVEEKITDFASFQELLDDSSTTDLVAYIMAGALKLGTSDVHIEAEKEDVVVRFRLDGMLHDAAVLPKEAFKKVVGRLKLLASLKINITDVPQDGRFSVSLPNGDVDVRTSTIPTIYGESVVMRLLVQDDDHITLDQLGIRGKAYEQLKREIKRPNGMIITTGPTGSGKTTTLYAIMQILNQSDVKIITLEDPVEYKIDGVNQSQIDHSKDYTFAKGLRSMLRQDPDIAMVGEIRDHETAEIAIQASLTGHLILSTTHTNDAFGAIPRFLSMDVKPFLLAPAMNCVIGQRLVRRLCKQCHKPTQLTPEQHAMIERELERLPEPEKTDVRRRPMQFYGPTGCETCNNTGYKGRMGIYEIFVIDATIEQAILSGNVTEQAIREIALRNGTITMRQDGIIKALEGITSVEEIERVTK